MQEDIRRVDSEKHAKIASEPDPHKRHKSTTHLELYFQFPPIIDPNSGEISTGYTIFARQENDGLWYGAVATCSPVDQFCRRKGRQVAHRRYFQKEFFCFGADRPTYEAAKFYTDVEFNYPEDDEILDSEL